MAKKDTVGGGNKGGNKGGAAAGGSQPQDGGKHKAGGKHGKHGGQAQSNQGRSKREEIVPWGFEAAAKEERRKKAEAVAAEAAARKAGREHDPSMAVKQAKPAQGEAKDKSAKQAAPGGGAGPQ